MTGVLESQDVTTHQLYLWEINMRENGYSRASIRSYTSAGRALLAYRETDTQEGWVNRYFNTRRGVLSAASLQVHRAAARHLFKFLGREIPLEDYRMPPVTARVAHPLPGGIHDVYRLLAASENNRDRYLTIAFCGLAGMRISEALACKPNDIDFGKRDIRITGKGEKVRYVPLSRKLMAYIFPVIIDQCADAPDEPFIQLVETSARQGIVAAGLQARLARPIASHDLRMTYGTFIYEQKKDIRLVQELLGHTSVETTQLYVGYDPIKARNAVDAAFDEVAND